MKSTSREYYDIAIVGGGINGVGIALEAAQHGLKVFLCEQNDLASATSSASSKLIHGGLRYLEQYEFHLVRESLREREILFHRAKHLVRPLCFLMPHQPSLRSKLRIRIGLFLYDHLYSSNLPKSKMINLNLHPASKILRQNYHFAFQYSDCITDDSRLVITNALAAKKLGATIKTYTKCVSVNYDSNYWQLKLEDVLGTSSQIETRCLVNATGPWVESFSKDILKIKPHHELATVKGSHLVLPKLYEGDYAFILQNMDKRVIFIIPYLDQYSLVGTTEIFYCEDLNNVTIAPEEISYLIQSVKQALDIEISKNDIIHHFSGVRALLKEANHGPSTITRDYLIEMTRENHPPLITLFGGKLTTYRSLAKKVIHKLANYFPHLQSLKERIEPLPGGDFSSLQVLSQELNQMFPWLPHDLLQRYISQYGTSTRQLLSETSSIRELGQLFGTNLYQCEIDYLVANEWAKTAEDILWRRTKLGYSFTKKNIAALQEYLATKFQNV